MQLHLYAKMINENGKNSNLLWLHFYQDDIPADHEFNQVLQNGEPEEPDDEEDCDDFEKTLYRYVGKVYILIAFIMTLWVENIGKYSIHCQSY